MSDQTGQNPTESGEEIVPTASDTEPPAEVFEPVVASESFRNSAVAAGFKMTTGVERDPKQCSWASGEYRCLRPAHEDEEHVMSGPVPAVQGVPEEPQVRPIQQLVVERGGRMVIGDTIHEELDPEPPRGYGDPFDRVFVAVGDPETGEVEVLHDENRTTAQENAKAIREATQIAATAAVEEMRREDEAHPPRTFLEGIQEMAERAIESPHWPAVEPFETDTTAEQVLEDLQAPPGDDPRPAGCECPYLPATENGPAEVGYRGWCPVHGTPEGQAAFTTGQGLDAEDVFKPAASFPLDAPPESIREQIDPEFTGVQEVRVPGVPTYEGSIAEALAAPDTAGNRGTVDEPEPDTTTLRVTWAPRAIEWAIEDLQRWLAGYDKVVDAMENGPNPAAYQLPTPHLQTMQVALDALRATRGDDQDRAEGEAVPGSSGRDPAANHAPRETGESVQGVASQPQSVGDWARGEALIRLAADRAERSQIQPSETAFATGRYAADLATVGRALREMAADRRGEGEGAGLSLHPADVSAIEYACAHGWKPPEPS